MESSNLSTQFKVYNICKHLGIRLCRPKYHWEARKSISIFHYWLYLLVFFFSIIYIYIYIYIYYAMALARISLTLSRHSSLSSIASFRSSWLQSYVQTKLLEMFSLSVWRLLIHAKGSTGKRRFYILFKIRPKTNLTLSIFRRLCLRLVVC